MAPSSANDVEQGDAFRGQKQLATECAGPQAKARKKGRKMDLESQTGPRTAAGSHLAMAVKAKDDASQSPTTPMKKQATFSGTPVLPVHGLDSA